MHYAVYKKKQYITNDWFMRATLQIIKILIEKKPPCTLLFNQTKVMFLPQMNNR